MSVVIRMQRAGGRNYPFFRVVVADSRRARDGRFLEKVGFYNPLSQPAQVQIDQERVRFWIERGARPSESVAVLLKKSPLTPGTSVGTASVPAMAAVAPQPVQAAKPPEQVRPQPAAEPEAAPAPAAEPASEPATEAEGAVSSTETGEAEPTA